MTSASTADPLARHVGTFTYAAGPRLAHGSRARLLTASRPRNPTSSLPHSARVRICHGCVLPFSARLEVYSSPWLGDDCEGSGAGQLVPAGATTKKDDSHMNDFLTAPGRSGTFGAILDETARAAGELCRVVEAIDPERYDEARLTPNPQITSIRSICIHVVNWAYAYSNYIRNAKGEPTTLSAPLSADALVDPKELRLELGKALAHTEVSLAGLWEASPAEIFALSFQVPWGPTFDPETILERGLAHILRHRRQIECW